MLQNHQVVKGMACNISPDLGDFDIPNYINTGDKMIYTHGIYSYISSASQVKIGLVNVSLVKVCYVNECKLGQVTIGQAKDRLRMARLNVSLGWSEMGRWE